MTSFYEDPEVIDTQRHLINSIKLEHGEKTAWSTEARTQFARQDTILVERLDKKEQNASSILMGLDKRNMVSTTKAATADEKALYNVKYQKHKKEFRGTNFTLGTDKQRNVSEAGGKFQNHGSKVYAAAMEKTTKDVQKTNYKMGTDKHDWKTTAHFEPVALTKEARQAAIESKKMSQSTSVVLGNKNKQGYFETSSGANVAIYTGGQILRPDGKDLRKSNISLGRSNGAFETTAQRSFTSHTKEQVKNSRPERGVDVRASVLTIGKGKHETPQQSVCAANYGAIDTAKHRPERVHKKMKNTSVSMGVHPRDWSTNGRMPTPNKSVKYRATTKIKTTMSKTNWNAGNDKVRYVSQTAASASRANLPIVRTQLAEPARSNNITLGHHKNDYKSEGSLSFKDTKITSAGLREHKKATQAMKKKVRQSKVSMGNDKPVYNTSSKDALFNPKGDNSAYKMQSKIDRKKQNKTNFVMGYSGPQFDTTAKATLFSNQGEPAKLTKLVGKKKRTKRNKFAEQLRTTRGTKVYAAAKQQVNTRNPSKFKQMVVNKVLQKATQRDWSSVIRRLTR